MKRLTVIFKCMILVLLVLNIGMVDAKAEENKELIVSLENKIKVEYDAETQEHIIKGINDGGKYYIHTVVAKEFGTEEYVKKYIDQCNSCIGKEKLNMATITDDELKVVVEGLSGQAMTIEGRDNSVSTKDIRIKDGTIISISRVDESSYKRYYYNDNKDYMDIYSVTESHTFLLDSQSLEESTEEENTEQDNNENNNKNNNENNQDIENNQDNKEVNNITKLDESPKTGDTAEMMYVNICALISIAGIVVLLSRNIKRAYIEK